MSLISIKRFLLPDIREIFTRFTNVILCALVLTAIGIAQIHGIDISRIDQWVVRLICLLFALLSVRLFAENHGYGRKAEIGMAALIMALLIVVSWNFLFLIPGLLLLIMVAPYLNKREDEAACCHFNCAVGISVFFAGITTAILCGGISGALASIGYLFEMRIDSKIYADMWAVGFGCFAVLYALAGIPRDVSMPNRTDYPKGVRFLLLYVLCPLMIVYMLILYAYFIKIAVQWELPKGNLSRMIVSYGTLGVFIHLFVHPLRDEKHVLMRLFHRYFYYALPIPVIFLFIAAYTRIDQYGLTEQRYALYLTGVWLGFSSLYVIFTRQQRLKPIVLSLSVLLILASFGPWGATGLSTLDQKQRLEALLVKNNILVDGKIVPGKEYDPKEITVGLEENKQISSLVEFLLRRERGKALKEWFPENSYIRTTKDKRIDVTRVMKDMGLSYMGKWQRTKASESNFYIHAPIKQETDEGALIEIGSYDYMLRLSPPFRKGEKWSRAIMTPQGELRLSYDDGIFTAANNQGNSVALDLITYAKEWKAAHPSNVDKGSNRNTSSYMLEKNDGNFLARIIVMRLSGDIDTRTVSSADFQLLVKMPPRSPIVSPGNDALR